MGSAAEIITVSVFVLRRGQSVNLGEKNTYQQKVCYT